jgi:3-oxoacyl-[acyl-carrier protein] reductase
MNYLISGAGGSIGKKIVEELYNSSDNFILLYNSKKKNLKKKNLNYIKCDFRNLKEVKDLINFILKKFSKIDVFINCAGNANPYKNAFDISNEELESSLRINFKSPLIIMNQIIQNQIKKKLKLNIVNISTNTIKYNGSKYNLPYLCSKAALESACKNLSKTYIDRNIRINIIRPGLINSNMSKKIKGYTSKKLKKRITLIPLKKIGTPNDIAKTVKFIISKDSNYIHGQIFTIAGGE